MISGISLLILSVAVIGKIGAGILFIFGLLSIVAAIAYTTGKKPYGYIGLGDIAVFIFFGMIGVLGTFYLQIGELNDNCFLLAFAYGFLSVGVLNLNNMRDLDSDKTAGKLSIPVRLGLVQSKMYHYGLLAGAGICFTIFTFNTDLNWLFLLPAWALILYNANAVYAVKIPGGFDPLLKHLSVSTFIITLLLFLTQLI